MGKYLPGKHPPSVCTLYWWDELLRQRKAHTGIYYEEFTECCQPEDSAYSVICAKGQGCAVTDGDSPETRVPYCVDSFDACRACADKHDPLFNTYLCHVHGSDMCYRSPDPVTCKQEYGPSATFCYGVLAKDPIFHDVTSNES